MDKMRMETRDLTAENVKKIGELFPNCITETIDENGKPKKVVNFDVLRQMLSGDIVEGDEAYEFTWVGKKASIVEANRPIRKTLRPCPEESLDWDTTENLYIEGDNLEVLKLLQNSYLGKVKMIYIDPPYNTGHDFVYPDSFVMERDEYDYGSGYFDENGNVNYSRENGISLGLYHSDWCSMMYSRLLLSRSLLREDGVIFISIDENEEANAKRICEEIFGGENCLGIICNTNNPKGRSDDKFIATAHEYILAYAKQITKTSWYGFEPTEEITKRYNKTDNEGRRYREIDLRKTGENDLREDRPNLFYYFYYNESTGNFYPSRKNDKQDGYILIKPEREDGREGNWRWGIDTATAQIHDLVPKFMPTRKVWGVMQKDYLEGRALVKPTSSWTFKDVNSERGTEDFTNLGFDKRIFPKPKPIGTVERCLKLSSRDEKDIILDFFSGSATTAHAVMRVNNNDSKLRRFIMIQLPEPCNKNAEAFKMGYYNICEIGKERIRRAGKKIKGENPLTAQDLDVGFRVFKLDESNMTDVFYAPNEYTQDLLTALESNVKPDRTDLDLLFGCVLDWALPLSMPYKSEKIGKCTVHTYGTESDPIDLIACFDENVPKSVIETIAKRRPLRAVFRDGSFADSPAKINVGEIFKTTSPITELKVI